MSLLLSFGSFMESVLYILLALVALLVMIMIHELGHYTAGKLLKFKINEFSVGFGKALWSKTKKSGEKISLRLIPLGGYCAFEGEDEDGKENPEAFNNQKPWKRLIVLFMGAFFNLLSGVIFSVICLTCFGYADRIQVTSVNYDHNPYQTQQEWFMEGDIIYGVNDEKTTFVYDKYFTHMIVGYEDTQTFNVNVLRDGKKVVVKANIHYEQLVSITDTNGRVLYALTTSTKNLKNTDYVYYLEHDAEEGIYYLKATNDVNVKYESDTKGVFTIGDLRLKVTNDGLERAMIGIGTKYYRYGFFEALLNAVPFTLGWAWKVLIFVFNLIIGKGLITNLTGPIGTISTMASVSQAHISNFFVLLPMLSANLAVLNLLPVPALDGARMVFVAIEWIFRKPINRKVEGYIHTIGMLVLFAFVIVVDLLHFIL